MAEQSTPRPKVRATIETDGGSQTASAPSPRVASAPKPRIEASVTVEAAAPNPEPAQEVTPTPQPRATSAPKPRVEATAPAAESVARPDERLDFEDEPSPSGEAFFAERESTHEQHAVEQPMADDSQSASQGEGKTAAHVRRSLLDWVHRTFAGHEHAFWGGVVALVIVLLVFAIGFWRVLFIALAVLVGVAIGQLLDGDPKLINAVRSLLDSDREQGFK